MTIGLGLTLLGFTALGYIYFGYPIALYLLGRLAGKAKTEQADTLELPTIGIVIAAHNEEAIIAEKLNNHLALNYPLEKLRIYLCSDGSSDNTVAIASAIAAEQAPARLVVTENPERGGKTSAINHIAPTAQADCDLLLFSDANVLLDDQALLNTARAFADTGTGGIAGTLLHTNEGESLAAASAGLYWRYEEWIKQLESNTGSLMGADGSIFCIRSEHFSPLPLHVLDDFSTSMGVIFNGQRLRFEPSVVAYEKVAEQKTEEFPRKIRIANRSYGTYQQLKPRILKISATNLWKFYSHKWLRWHSLAFMILMLAGNALWVMQSELIGLPSLVLLGQVVFYLVAVFAWLGNLEGNKPWHRLANVCQYFVMANVATGIGIWRWYRGARIITWQSASSSR